ncbi:long-chain-fatty-acid--CoA ligase 2 [[Candida] jaroonii]|uniref:Long-chain-fatty-acid--CoA ligase 2 n=1 Tax=[Candida] jaroonii TaxID=467808 RepID=A0ACA9Y2A0_9ASCO|nr:long-chain-fatty-acid--CoA ligase 2 [[Candida] jaroonii]
MLAPIESEYVLENPNNEPVIELFRKCLPLDEKVTKSRPVVGTETDGYSAIYRNQAFPERKKYVVKGLETVHSSFDIIADENPENECFKYRPFNYLERTNGDYITKSFKEVKEMKDHFGSGMLYHLMNNPFKDAKFSSHQKIDNHIKNYQSYDNKNDSFIVTLYSNNRWEWLLADLACASYSITDTALYNTLGENTSEYILELTESPMVICSREHIKTLISLKKQYPEKLATLISIVSMDPLFVFDQYLFDLAEEVSIKLTGFDQIMEYGKNFPLKNLPPKPETLYTISFTSGTTGSNPKGVSLTHSAAASSLCFLLTSVPMTRNSFSFLPYAHIFERETVFFTLSAGGCVILPQLNYSPLTLIEDLKMTQPERVSLVPRVYNKFEAAIKNATINSPNVSELKRSLFKKAFDSKIYNQALDDKTTGKSLIYDSLIIKKIRAQFGFDNMVYAITGSAPIDPETVRFLRASLQFGFCQGYGLTETFAGICLSAPFEGQPGSSGPPAVNTEMKLRAIPEMNYGINDAGGPRGELMIRSYQNFSEYYKNPEETQKVLQDGWFSTGDIARIDEKTGRVYIIDRVKNFFKLSQGEYISPEAIENTYQTSNPLLSQMFIHGDSLKTFLVSVLGIDKVSSINFLAKQCGIDVKQLSNISDSEVIKLMNDKKNRKILVNYLNKNVPQLKGFQKVRNVSIEFEPLTLDRNVVTPTMKLKRPIAKKFFEDTLNQMYEEGPLNDAKL